MREECWLWVKRGLSWELDGTRKRRGAKHTTIFPRRSRSALFAFGGVGRFRRLPTGLGFLGVEGVLGVAAVLLATGRQVMA